jgi:hypothetical protein
MIHRETVNSELVEIAQKLSSMSELNTFRLVGGTAVALQLGHRISVDIDFFSNEKLSKQNIVQSLAALFPGIQVFIGTNNIRTSINGVRLELYDQWHTPFKRDPITIEGIRMATLHDIAAFKLEAITERREKKDYIDLYFIFNKLGEAAVLEDFRNYNPHISMKSILFALGEVSEASNNKSVMPEMLSKVDWDEIKESMLSAAKTYLSIHKK